MKRFIALFLLLVLTFSLCACDKNKDKPVNNPSIHENTNTNNSSDAVSLSYTHKVPGKDIVFDVPNWEPMELTHEMITTVYKIHGSKYVAITTAEETVSTLKEAHEATMNVFKANMYRYHPINAVSIKAEKTEMVNGLEVYKFEGTMNCKAPDNSSNDYDAYVICYSFIAGNVPCSIIGSVQDVAQEQVMIDEIKATVEAMLLTLRDKK